MKQAILRTFVISIAIAGLTMDSDPAIAANVNLVNNLNVTSSGILIAQQKGDDIDVAILEEAATYLEQAADALQAANEAVDAAAADEFFQAAIDSMAAAADVMQAVGIPNAANAMNNFTNAVEAAGTAETKQEEQQYIDAAAATIQNLQAALDGGDA